MLTLLSIFMNSAHSILNVEVSRFRNCFDPNDPQRINLRTWLTDDQHWNAIQQIRACRDEQEQKRLKLSLPAITPAALLTTRAGTVPIEDALLQHSGFIGLDIDGKDNPDHNMIRLRAEIARIKQVAYCGLTVRGNGLWLLIPIADPKRHLAHYEALKHTFAQSGVKIDASKGGNLKDLRGYSYDSDAYFNDQAETFNLTIDEPTKPERAVANVANPGANAADADRVIYEIIRRGLDITGDYQQWFQIGCTIANLYGESGREIFHRLSLASPKYNRPDTDRQYTAWLRKRSNYSLGTLFYFAKLNGLTSDQFR